MAGHSIYIDCAENMAELMATYPSELTDGVDLHMGDPSPEEISEIMSGYTGVLNGHTVMPKPLLEAHVEILRSVVFLGTGVANYVDPAAGEALGIKVRHIARYGDRSIAEHAFSLLMAAARGLGQMDREIRSGTWQAFEGIELAGKTLGVVGAGAVGSELIRIDRWSPTARGTRCLHGRAALERIAPGSPGERDPLGTRGLENTRCRGQVDAPRP